MDVVVYLALIVLIAVFFFSLLVLITVCRKYQYARVATPISSFRFSKLQQENVDDIIQLGPQISKTLNSNVWLEEVSGILQHCVAVLKLCHSLAESVAKIPLNQITPELNDLICKATSGITPRFEALLKSLSSKNVDIRVIEARVSSLGSSNLFQSCICCLVSASWSLVIPFLTIGSAFGEKLRNLIDEMESHHRSLQLALEHVEDELRLRNDLKDIRQIPSTSSERTDVDQPHVNIDDKPLDVNGIVSIAN